MQRALLTILLAVGLLTGCATPPTPDHHEQAVLVLWEGSPGAASADNPLARGLLDAVGQRLHQDGWRVYGPEVLEATALPVRRRLDTGALADLARHNATWPGADRPLRIDRVVALSGRAYEQHWHGARQLDLRVGGRVVDAGSGRLLGTAELRNPAGALSLPADCHGPCRRSRLRDAAAEAGTALGDELADLLAGSDQAPTTAPHHYRYEGPAPASQRGRSGFHDW